MNAIRTLGESKESVINKRADFLQLFRQAPIPDNELLNNLGLYLNRQTLSRILFMHDLYQKVIGVRSPRSARPKSLCHPQESCSIHSVPNIVVE